MNLTASARLLIEDMFNRGVELLASNPVLFIFIVSTLSNSIPYLSLPYYTILLFVASLCSDPRTLFLIALVSAIGATIGKLVVYLVGRGILALSKEETKRRVAFFSKLIRRWGWIVIFIAAMTPIPDDVVYIPLAFSKFDVIPYLTAVLLGKIVLKTFIVFAGSFALQFLVEKFLLPTQIAVPILIIASIVIMVVIVKIDWEEVTKAYIKGGSRGAFVSIADQLGRLMRLVNGALRKRAKSLS